MVSAQLKAAIEKAEKGGRTRYRISLDSGVNPSILTEFMNGNRSLKLGTVDRLCEHLGLELRPIPKSRR